jgi:hypothetical protein
MKKILSISLFFVLLAYIVSRSFFDGFWGNMFFFSLLPGFFMPFFVQKEKVVQMIFPLVSGSLLYGFSLVALMETNLVLWHLKNNPAVWRSSLWRDDIMGALLITIFCFIGGLAGIVAQGILSRFFTFRK